MPNNFQFSAIRKVDFHRWCKGQNVPGFSHGIFTSVFDYLLSHQDEDGTWKHQYWTVVQTAVVLKSLAALGFTAGDEWKYTVGGKEIAGGILKPLNYLCDQLRAGGQVGEDNWDKCQALLAVAAFGRKDEGRDMAGKIGDNWKILYQSEVEAREPNVWCGPSYLAAMIDVMVIYSDVGDPGAPANIAAALSALKALEKTSDDGKPTGCFPACIPSGSLDRWNTGLVLRTLCGVAHGDPTLLDQSLVERCVEWLLAETKASKGWASDGERAPMFRSRCLEGLHAAIPFVTGGLGARIKSTLKLFNAQIEKELQTEKATLKTRTAVGEYLAELTLSVPAATLFEIGDILEEEEKRGGASGFVPRQNGFRMVWLTDIHVAEQFDEQPYRKGYKPGLLGGLKFVRGNELTENFQSGNLQRILTEVEKLKPDHILVTGDLTNWALPNQFEKVQKLFYGTQSRLRGTNANGRLDPQLWTVLPGNHDTTSRSKALGAERRHLGLFFHYFGETYENISTTNGDYDLVFPFKKSVGKPGSLRVRLVGLDSTVQWPVSAVGINALGRIDQNQKLRLAEMLAEDRNDLTLVALHHHPVPVPETLSKWEDYFLSLDPGDARDLIKICANESIPAILHGHYHVYSHWQTKRPNGRRPLQIIGASSGTLCVPDDGQEEFFELREGSLNGVPGLALFKYKHTGSDQWAEHYCTFIA